MRFANFEALARVSGANKLSMNLPLLFLRFFTLLFLIFALSGPIFWYDGEGGTFNYVIALDASGSMLANDFDPNRLEAAKNAALAFIDRVPADSKVGLMSFSGTTFVKHELSDDTDAVRESMNSVEIEFASGTAVGDAIISAVNLLISEEEGRSVILLTDGQSNVGTYVEKAINYANEKFVTVNTIGMATSEGGQLPDIEAVSTLDEDSLVSIARNTGGSFYKAENNDQLQSAYAEIARTSTKKLPVKLTLWLIILTFITLSVEWVIVNTKFRSVP